MSYVEEDRGFTTPCWIWTGALHAMGYGVIWNSGNGGTLAHRLIYQQHVRPLVKGEVLHHRCEVPACVNPAHVQPMTQSEHMKLHHPRNVITHCVHGHLYDEANTYYWPNGSRKCKTCHRQGEARRRAARRAAVAA